MRRIYFRIADAVGRAVRRVAGELRSSMAARRGILQSASCQVRPSGPTWTANSTEHNPPAQNLSFSTDDVCFPSSTPPCTTTFNLDFGAPLSTDLIIVGVADNSALSRTVKVNGTTCTQIGIDPQDRSGLYQCTGISTAAIKTSRSSAPGGAYQYLAVAVGVLHGLTSSTATATGGNCAVAEPDRRYCKQGAAEFQRLHRS